MKFLDAQNRKKSYIFSRTSTFKINFNSEEYLEEDITKRIDFMENKLEGLDISSAAAHVIDITVNDTEEHFLDDEEIQGVISNALVLYSRRFPRQDKFVMRPKKKLLEELPATPISLITAMQVHVVNKPIQIIVHRIYNNGESEEEVRLV